MLLRTPLSLDGRDDRRVDTGTEQNRTLSAAVVSLACIMLNRIGGTAYGGAWAVVDEDWMALVGFVPDVEVGIGLENAGFFSSHDPLADGWVITLWSFGYLTSYRTINVRMEKSPGGVSQLGRYTGHESCISWFSPPNSSISSARATLGGTMSLTDWISEARCMYMF